MRKKFREINFSKDYNIRRRFVRCVIVLVFITLIGVIDVFLFTYISYINGYKALSNVGVKDIDVVRNMDLDIKKYDDVIYTVFKREGINVHKNNGTDGVNSKIKTLEEGELNKVRKSIIKYTQEELLGNILEKSKKKPLNIHIKVTSYMYHNNVIAHFVEKMCINQLNIEGELKEYLIKIYGNVKYFPIAYLNSNKGTYPYDNSWGNSRDYGGIRRHEGIDIMYSENKSDVVPVVSVSDGTIEKKGWLELGGNRLLIKTRDNMKFYYAHLASYAQGLEEGMKVRAGQLIGYMGNTGYGPEGTKGKFDVHLHFGMYFSEKGEEISINPYFLLKFLDINKLYYK